MAKVESMDVTASHIGQQSLDYSATGIKPEEAKLFGSNKIGDVAKMIKGRSVVDAVSKR